WVLLFRKFFRQTVKSHIFILIVECIALVFLFSLSAFFSGCETVLFSLSPIQVQQLRERNQAAGQRVEKLMETPAMILSTLLVGNTLVNFAIATLGYLILATILPAYAKLVAIPLMTLMLLLFGEVTPKRVALQYAEALAPVCSRLFLFWLWLLKPFNMLLTTGSAVFKQTLRRERRGLTDDELMTVVELSEEQGVLDTEEAAMMDGIMRLSELKASDEMIPRVDMIGLDLDTSVEKQLQIASVAHVRFLPAYVRTPDAIEGFVNTARFLLDPEHDVRKALVPAQFVPENMPLDDLLTSLQLSGTHIACVLDEYGGTAGLITRSDILELITEPVMSPTEKEHSMIQPLHQDVWLIDGTTSLEEVSRTLDIQLDADDADRIAGWVTFHAEHFPQPGERVEAQGVRVTVQHIRRRRIETVYLEVLQRAEPEDIEQEAMITTHELVVEHQGGGEQSS
ncbi:MAG: hemolysin family protein, partial [bacterium]